MCAVVQWKKESQQCVPLLGIFRGRSAVTLQLFHPCPVTGTCIANFGSRASTAIYSYLYHCHNFLGETVQKRENCNYINKLELVHIIVSEIMLFEFMHSLGTLPQIKWLYYLYFCFSLRHCQPLYLPRTRNNLKQISWTSSGTTKDTGYLFATWNYGGPAFLNLLRYYHVTQLWTIASWVILPAYNCWTEIEKLWLASVLPKNVLWNADADITSSTLLPPMSLLRGLWRMLKHKHPPMSKASILTAFLFNLKVAHSPTSQMSSPWMLQRLFTLATW